VIDLLVWFGKKITERWLTTIVLPGLLYAAVATWAMLAGHSRALDPHHLASRIEQFYREGAADPWWFLLVTIVGVLALGTAAGLVAVAAAHVVVSPVLTSQGPGWWRDRLRQRTERWWAGAGRQRVERYLPARASRVGERFRLVGERVHAQYGLSVVDVWPALWLLVTAATRETVGAANQRYRADTVLIGWGLLYLPLAIWWWPAAVIGVGTVLVGHRRALGSAQVLATTIEATVDAHQIELAKSVGVALPEGRITPVEGNQINSIVTRGATTDWLVPVYRLRRLRHGTADHTDTGTTDTDGTVG
jgi:hypothetical protein